ncbi:Dicer-like protein 2 [Parastagonospora nodorum]|nr:Dicer-like protein 2 [Parastagonospora nodorum]KAH3985473.1 Dicer-like protein 2 [Parastagonospora nodorum]KAH4003523.1 Dicer-like protein 2 [Parastagonospora nodorum]KAH4028956.1 Dicer-like protein 2 [Parastagonospora nodorum]KAH4037847.1 Dicer-like protein 2 [Parastagonospora nodorum]
MESFTDNLQPANDVGTHMADSHDAPFRLRSYQAEMVEESMQSNIICVMDTGSGKTHIAIDRTRAELEICRPDKIVWFLAPTVTLCEQQFAVFKSNLPGYGIQLLSGKDNLDHWTDQGVWDDVLLNIRIVLSTHQVLLDALSHGFVKMRNLSLLIFDEAHHCSLKHPAHRIMSDFYKPRIGTELPRILGLSASPIKTAKVTSEDLQQIERNLCATVKTPKLHRSELLRYVHRPHLMRIDYPVEPQDLQSNMLSFLKSAYTNYDLQKDPWVSELLQQRQQGHDVTKNIHKVFIGGKTYCRDQLRSLALKAEAMSQELGMSVMDWYLRGCITQFSKMVHMSDSQLLDWSADEKRHLLEILRTLPSIDLNSHDIPPMSLGSMSHKLQLLIKFLVAEAKHDPEFTCLVFVEQRVWVACIAEVLAIHPETRDLLRVGTFVGESENSKRKANIASISEPRNQQATLENFRAGKLNLILATSVLEEGIDVSSCHLVVCFESPKNLKSFVQRRGRARKEESKYVIFVPQAGRRRDPESWQSLEEGMKAAYLDDLRQVKLATEKEQQSETGHRNFEVKSTGALLTLDNASQHLHHFCSILGAGPYIDNRPQFEFTEIRPGVITARVILPLTVDPEVRTACALDTWATEKMAKQDAAFEAYKALYVAGLVNDNLLPARQEADDELSELQIPDHRPSLVPVSPTLDPWPLFARHQQQNPHVYYRTRLTLHTVDDKPKHLILLTPKILPDIPELLLYWNSSTKLKIESSWLHDVVLNDEEISELKSVTYKILYSVFHNRMELNRRDFVWLVAPCDESGLLDSRIWLSEWRQHTCLATELIAQNSDWSLWGLVNQKGDARKYIPRSTSMNNQLWLLQLMQLPKRRDFLHPVLESANINDAYTKTDEMAAKDCIVDPVPAPYSVFALLLPSILHRFGMAIIAETLRTTLLGPVALDSAHSLLLTRALKSSAADGNDNYQRLEFLGDCILKFIATVHLMAANPKWPESHLTAKKGRIVSNGFLARATIAAGLDRFMITKSFTGAKWAPRYAGDLLAETGPAVKEERSSKLIADIIESLIGACYTVGGFEKAVLCVQTLLPLEPWISVPAANSILHEAAPAEADLMGLDVLETLIGYTFKKKPLLLEALTHASFSGPHVHCSYERLEFLGDAVLDYIISKRLHAHSPELSHQKMHAIRTATVNASFLAFRLFETTIDEETINKTSMRPESQKRAIWQFLRSGSPSLNANRDSALRQHEQVRDEIIIGLNEAARFPWHLFALTDPPKFLSDMVESVIGAVYIDSLGDILTCEAIVRRLGILDCLDHILCNGVDCLHPKERLGHLAVDKGVQYARVGVNTEPNEGDKMYKCQVKVGGEDVGDVAEGLKRLNAETVAAWKAVGVLESRKDSAIEIVSDVEEFFDADDGGGISLDDP